MDSNHGFRYKQTIRSVPLFNIVLVSFLSMVVAIIIVRQTQELKQLEECMIENRLIRKTKQGIS